MKPQKKQTDPEGKRAINCINKKVKQTLDDYEKRQLRYKDRTEKNVQDVTLDIPKDYLTEVRKKIWEKNNPGKKWNPNM